MTDEKNSALNDEPAYWDSFADYPLDAAVIDPNDRRGYKNSYISSVRNTAILEALQSANQQLSILDFGCGTGSLLEALSVEGLDPTGVDISAGLLKRCRDRNIRKAPRIVQIDGKKLPFRDACFDAITVYIVLMYIADDELVQLLHEFARVLKPNGRVVMMEQFRRRERLVIEQGKLHRDLGSFMHIVDLAGLRKQSMAVFRHGHFPLIYFISMGWIPRRLWRYIRLLERLVGRLFGIFPCDYADVRVILDKPAPRQA